MIVLLGEFLQFHPQAFELCLPFPVFEELMHNDGQKQPACLVWLADLLLVLAERQVPLALEG